MRIPALFFLGLVFAAAGWSRDLPHYAVILSDPAPIKARAQGGTQAVESARAQVKATQHALTDELHARGIRITGAANTLLNAVFVAATPAEAVAIGAMPGVIQVTRLNRFHLSLDHAVQLINVPAAYSLIGGASNAGAGVKIAIIDTGITATTPGLSGCHAYAARGLSRFARSPSSLITA